MSGRHYHHSHAMQHPEPANPEYPSSYVHGLAYCGERSLVKPEHADRHKIATCPKCAAVIGKRYLKAKYGDRVRLEPAPEKIADRFKSAYAFHLDGELRGYIAIPRGFAEYWRLYRLLSTREEIGDYHRHGRQVSTDRPRSSWDAEKVDPASIFQPLHCGARDAMACAAVKAVEAGLLPTKEEADAQEIAAKAEEARLKTEREEARERFAKESERLAEERRERRDTARQGLEEIAKRGDLSNLELAGLQAALTIIGA